MPASTDVSSAIVQSLIPARMDRLPWTRFHIRLVMSLGTAWILDGLEITLASSVAGVLTARHRDPGPAGADAESSLLAPPAVGVIQMYPGTIPYIRAVRGKGLPTAVVPSANTTVNGADVAVKGLADLLDGIGQSDRSAR